MIFQLECKEYVECYCTEMHGWNMKDKWHEKVKCWKGQELAKLSKDKARNVWEHEMQDAQGQLASKERKATNGVEENATFSIHQGPVVQSRIKLI